MPLLLAPLALARGEEPDDLAANGDDRHRISLRAAQRKRIGNFMRPLTMPKEAEPWSLTSLRDKLIKMGTKVVSHGRYATFQMAEAGVRSIFREILLLIARTRAPPRTSMTKIVVVRCDRR